MGNALIKRVVQELQREFPGQISTFVTLSPIPGFKDWLTTQLELSAEQEGVCVLLLLCVHVVACICMYACLGE